MHSLRNPRLRASVCPAPRTAGVRDPAQGDRDPREIRRPC